MFAFVYSKAAEIAISKIASTTSPKGNTRKQSKAPVKKITKKQGKMNKQIAKQFLNVNNKYT